MFGFIDSFGVLQLSCVIVDLFELHKCENFFNWQVATVHICSLIAKY